VKFIVSGTRVEAVTLEIEAEDIDEAMAKASAGEFSGRDVDVWDTDYRWEVAMADYALHFE
jgi:hypothetical protein